MPLFCFLPFNDDNLVICRGKYLFVLSLWLPKEGIVFYIASPFWKTCTFTVFLVPLPTLQVHRFYFGGLSSELWWGGLHAAATTFPWPCGDNGGKHFRSSEAPVARIPEAVAWVAESPRGTDCHAAGFTEKEEGREATAGCLPDRMIKNNTALCTSLTSLSLFRRREWPKEELKWWRSLRLRLAKQSYMSKTEKTFILSSCLCLKWHFYLSPCYKQSVQGSFGRGGRWRR